MTVKIDVEKPAAKSLPESKPKSAAVDIVPASKSILMELEKCAKRAEKSKSNEKVAVFLMRIVILAGYFAVFAGGISFVISPCDSCFIPWLSVGMILPWVGSVAIANLHYFMAKAERQLVEEVRGLLAREGIKAKIELKQRAVRAIFQRTFYCGRVRPSLPSFVADHLAWYDPQAFLAHLIQLFVGVGVFVAGAYRSIYNAEVVKAVDEEEKERAEMAHEMACRWGRLAAFVCLSVALVHFFMEIFHMCHAIGRESKTAKGIRQLANSIRAGKKKITDVVINSRF